LRETTPPSYRWWQHVLLIALFTGAGLVLVLSQWEGMTAAGWAFFAATLVFLNFGEYASHRWSMHVLRRPYPVYHRHVIEHHAFFTAQEMEVDTIADLRWVLFPPWALPLLVLSVSPFFLVLWAVAPAGWAWIYLMSVVLYYGIYEVLHALAHLPAQHPLAGSRFVQRVTHHHRVHHDPALMSHWNFNFALPLFDWVFDTTYGGSMPAIHEPRRSVSTGRDNVGLRRPR
jgi:hypothetical protein